jgi:hypothetical protein
MALIINMPLGRLLKKSVWCERGYNIVWQVFVRHKMAYSQNTKTTFLRLFKQSLRAHIALRRTNNPPRRFATQSPLLYDDTGTTALVEAIETKKSQSKVCVRSLQEIHYGKQLTADEHRQIVTTQL